MTQKWIDRSIGWTTLLLIALFLAGCSNTVAQRPELPPIYVTQGDISCMATTTKRQIVQHNCKVDYDKTVCTFKENK